MFMLPSRGWTAGIVGSMTANVVTNWASSVSCVVLFDCCQAHIRLLATVGFTEDRPLASIAVLTLLSVFPSPLLYALRILPNRGSGGVWIDNSQFAYAVHFGSDMDRLPFRDKFRKLRISGSKNAD